MRPFSSKVGPLVAPAANNIGLSQTPGATGVVLLNGSLAVAVPNAGTQAVLDTYRRVLITTAGNESAKTMTIVGTTHGGLITTEVMAMANAGTTFSTLDFKNIISMTMSSAAAGAITVGTNGVANSDWFPVDAYANGEIALQVTVSGTVSYTIQSTLDDPNNPQNPATITPYGVTWVSSADTTVVTATATAQSNYLMPPRYIRALLNSQTNPGFIVATFIQPGGSV